MSKTSAALPGSLAALVLSSMLVAAQSQNQQTQSSATNTKKSSTTKKAAANPKKPAEAKDTGDPDKVKTDERMSTRGLKPKKTDQDKQKPENPPKQ